MPASDELIAHSRTEDEVARTIGADWLIFQDLDDLIDAVKQGNREITQLDASVFTGEYVTGNVDREYLDDLQKARHDAAKSERREKDNEVMDLHNTA